MTDSGAPDSVRSCIHCGEPLVGPYCHACGQDNTRQNRPLGSLLKSALSENFNLDGQVFETVRSMAWRPGDLLVAYREGRTQAFVSPIKLFLVVSAIFFVALTSARLMIYQYLPVPTGPEVSIDLVPNGLIVRGADLNDVFLAPASDGSERAALTRAIDAVEPLADPVQQRALAGFRAYESAWDELNDVFGTWLPRLLWLLMPIYALMLWPFYRRHGLAEHLVFSLWAHCMIFILLMIYAATNALGLHLWFWLITAPYVGYFALAASRYYGEAKWKAAIKGLAHGAAYVCLVFFPILLALGYGLAGDKVPADFWIAETEVDGGDGWILPPGTAP